jgi:ABC-type antimicrobial peptide transport system permease subunit
MALVAGERRELTIRAVTPGYLRVLRVPLLRGRDLDRRDAAGAPGAAVLTEATANQLWPGVDPVGRELTIEGRTFVVVGVVANLHHRGLEFAVVPEAYVPIAQRGASGGTLVVRTTGDPYRVLAPIKRAIWSVNPNQQITQVATADEDLRRQTAPRRFNMLLMAVFAALALTIAVTGLYGVMAHMVGERTREIAIRVALGATPASVVMLVGRQGAMIVLAGLVAGAAGAWIVGQSISTFLFEVRAHDSGVFAAASVVLAFAGVAACCPPILRAIRVDPIHALRTQ